MAGRERNAEGVTSAVPEADAAREFGVEERTGKQKESADSRAELTPIENRRSLQTAGQSTYRKQKQYIDCRASTYRKMEGKQGFWKGEKTNPDHNEVSREIHAGL